MTILALTTPDPRFNPEHPVTINGYLYVPTADRGVGVPVPQPERPTQEAP